MYVEKREKKRNMKNYGNSHRLVFTVLSPNFPFSHLMQLPIYLHFPSMCVHAAVDQAKHGCKSNRSDCARRKCNRRGTLTSQMEQLIGEHFTAVRVSDRIRVTCFTLFHTEYCEYSSCRRSQTLSPVRNYSSGLSSPSKEPKFVTIKRIEESFARPYKVSMQLSVCDNLLMRCKSFLCVVCLSLFCFMFCWCRSFW